MSASALALDLRDEALHRKVAAVHLHDGARSVRERALVVVDVRAVGRADFDEPRAAALHDVGDAEAAADLDQLAARDDGLPSLRERVEREHQRRRAVVDDERVLGAGELAEQADAVRRSAIRARRRRGRTRGSCIRSATRAIASIAPSASGARPRFVCSTTPVALMTRRSDGCVAIPDGGRDALDPLLLGTLELSPALRAALIALLTASRTISGMRLEERRNGRRFEQRIDAG